MHSERLNRRAFLRRTLAITSATTLLDSGPLLVHQALGAERGPQSLRLGGPAFANAKDPEELALAHRKLGYRAAYCPDLPLDDSARIRAYADAFARHDVVVAEVG